MERARGQSGRIALLILYGIGVVLLSVVGLWRQSLMVRQLARWGVGDLGVAARAVGPERRVVVLEVLPGSPARGVLQADDEGLRVTDMDLVVLPPTRRLFAIPDPDDADPVVQPGRSVRLLYVRDGRERHVALRLREEDAWAPLDPAGPLGLFLFATLLPTWLTQWGFLVIGWLVFARRPRARDAQLFFLLFVTGALSFSTMFGRPDLYPLPLRWLCEHNIVVGAWVGALAAHFAHGVPEGKAFYQRFRGLLLTVIYLPAVSVTALGIAATLTPAARPLLEWLWPRFGVLCWVPAMLLVAAGLLESATTPSGSARRRQGRTLLLGLLPFLVLTISDELYSALYGEPLVASLPVVYIAQSATSLLIPITFGYAILREGLLDLGVVLRRGLVYAAVIAVGVAGYYLLVLGTGQILVALTGQTNSFATMAATLALATVLRPIAAQFRRLVDQAFYRDRLETARRLRALSQGILSLLDRDAILTQLTSQLPAVFPAAGATLFLFDPAAEAYVAAGQSERARERESERAREGNEGVATPAESVPAGSLAPSPGPGPTPSAPPSRSLAPSPAPSLSPSDSLLVRRLQKSGRPVGTYDVEAHSAEAILAATDRELARRLGAVLWLPIMLRDFLLGILALGWKVSEEIYTEEELDALTLIASEAAVALENAALSEQRTEQARLQQEVAIARSIQMRLLPATRLCLEGYEILSRSEPAAEVGGDFYNLFEVGRPSGEERGSETGAPKAWGRAPGRERDGGAEGVGPGPGEGARAGSDEVPMPGENVPAGSLAPPLPRLGILLGDVSGKGVPGALFMAVTTTLVEAQARLLSSPAETLVAANAQLHPKMRRPGTGQAPMFATAVYGILDRERREIRLASAGQTPPVYWPAGGPPRYLRLTGVPLGALPHSRYEEMTVALRSGDRLLLCSDGFIEATEGGGQSVGYVGFLRRVAALGDRSGPELIETLFASEPGTEEGIERDDRTLVLVTVR